MCLCIPHVGCTNSCCFFWKPSSRCFFIIFLKDLWMVISLQSLSFSPILLSCLCPTLCVSVCVCFHVHACADACLSSQVRLTLPFLSDVTERLCMWIEACLNNIRGISICFRHHLAIYCTLTLLPLWLSGKKKPTSVKGAKMSVVTLPHYSHYPL